MQFEVSRKIPLPTNKTYAVFSDPGGFKVLGDYTVNKGETITIEKRVNELIPLNDERIFNIDEFLVSEGFTEEDKFLPKFASAIIETGETDDIDEANELAHKVWNIIESSASYGFNSSHAYCMGVDSNAI